MLHAAERPTRFNLICIKLNWNTGSQLKDNTCIKATRAEVAATVWPVLPVTVCLIIDERWAEQQQQQHHQPNTKQHLYF